MEHHCRGIKRYRSVGYDSRVVPALVLGIVHEEHMIREILAESECAVVRLNFRCFNFFYLYIKHDVFLRLSILYFYIIHHPLTIIKC